MPKKFMETMDKHAAEDALVFKGIGFFEIGAACMLGELTPASSICSVYIDALIERRSLICMYYVHCCDNFENGIMLPKIGKLGWLADHVVSCSETPKARDELISLMKQRLVPVKRAPKKSE
mmetsp:Transcript_1547/g.3747  ORF Transcript_1547/g.3747 Transcript_1547/m.3747 type:complete len:121 (+) Transcript_1547:1685-2047(+)